MSGVGGTSEIIVSNVKDTVVSRDIARSAELGRAQRLELEKAVALGQRKKSSESRQHRANQP